MELDDILMVHLFQNLSFCPKFLKIDIFISVFVDYLNSIVSNAGSLKSSLNSNILTMSYYKEIK